MVTALEEFAGDFSEEPLDLVDPRRIRGREMNMEPLMLAQPVPHQRVFVRAVVVTHDVDVEVVWNVFVDLG